MAEKRDTKTYELWDSREKVYIGTTNNPARREEEHRKAGKNFSKMVITSGTRTEKSAKEKETEDLGKYRKGHSGKGPKYNKDSDG